MQHHKLIKALITEIRNLGEQRKALIAETRNLSEQIDSATDYQYYEQEKLAERNQQLMDEMDRMEYKRRLEEQEQLSRQWQIEETMKKLERAERWG